MNILVPLYISFATLQGLDVDSTSRALSAGAREANPVMRMEPVHQIALKAAGTAGIIVLCERLRKDHPKIALFLMIGLTSAQASIVAHNYSLRP